LSSSLTLSNNLKGFREDKNIWGIHTLFLNVELETFFRYISKPNMFILKYFVARPPHPYPYCLWLSSNDFLCIFFSLWYSQNVNDFLNNTLLKTIPFILIDIKIKIMKISSFNCWKKSWSNPTTTIFTSNTSSGYYSVFAQFIRSRNHWRVLWGYVKRSIEPGPLVGPGQIS